MILVTGATGKTGRAVVTAAVARGLPVRAALHRREHESALRELGAVEAVNLDLEDVDSLQTAMRGVSAIYHICPNVHPREVQIGETLIALARQAGVERIVYHSVLHPHLEAMPHHWRKMRVEEALLQSGIACTIVQPTAYMQNLRANLHRDDGDVRFVVPYSLDARISLVHLEDVAEVAAMLLAGERESGGIYPLVGTPPYAQRDVANRMTRALGREVTPVAITPEAWRTLNPQLDSQRADALLRMFAYYDRYGLVGSTRILRNLLSREPRSLQEYLQTWHPSRGAE